MTFKRRQLLQPGSVMQSKGGSLHGKSRSDCVRVAVGFSRLQLTEYGGEKARVAERRLSRRASRALQASLRDARFLRSLTVG